MYSNALKLVQRISGAYGQWGHGGYAASYFVEYCYVNYELEFLMNLYTNSNKALKFQIMYCKLFIYFSY